MRRSDWLPYVAVVVISIACGLWWQGLETRAADAAKPLPSLPEKAGPPRLLKEPAKGRFKVGGVKSADAAKGRKRMSEALIDGAGQRWVEVAYGDSNVVTSATMCALMSSGCVDEFIPSYVKGGITLEEYLSLVYLDANSNCVSIGGWLLSAGGTEDDDPALGAVHYLRAVLQAPDGTRYLLHASSQAGTSGLVTQMSDSVTVTLTYNGYRLGARYKSNVTDNPYPFYSAKHGDVEYGWFGDEDTTIVSTCAGHTHTEHPYEAVTHAGFIIGAISGGVAILSDGVDAAIISAITCYGETISFEGLLDGCLKGFGGEARANTSYGSGSGGGFYVAPPIRFRIGGRITKCGAAAPGWAQFRINDYSGATHTLGDDGPIEVVRWWQSWPYADGLPHAINWLGQSVSLDATWSAANGVPLTDYPVPIYVCPPRRGYHSDAAHWTHATLTTLVQNVNRPDGRKPSIWASGNPSAVEVIEAEATTTFRVHTPGATAANRTMVVNWHDYIDIPGEGEPPEEWNPLWATEAYRRTKHLTATPADNGPGLSPGEDIWWWTVYGYMLVEITAPGPDSLTLTVNTTHLSVYDGHMDGSIEGYPLRWFGMEFTETPGSATYTIRWTADDYDAATGRYRVWVDLLFPDGATAPTHLGRVDSMSLSGFSLEGDYVLHGMTLRLGSPENVSYSLFLGLPEPKRRRSEEAEEGMTEEERRRATPEWPTMMVALDGSFGFYGYLDDTRKNDMTGGGGGSIRSVEPLEVLISAGGDTIRDYQNGLNGFLSYVNQIEGLEVAIAAGDDTFGALCSDDYGSVLTTPFGDGSPYVDWLVPITPGDTSTPPVPPDPSAPPPEDKPSNEWSLQAGVACNGVWLVNATPEPITLTVDWPLWSSAQTLVTSGGRRLTGENVPVYARRADTDDVVATGYTDRSGFAQISPLPGPNDVDYQIYLDVGDGDPTNRTGAIIQKERQQWRLDGLRSAVATCVRSARDAFGHIVVTMRNKCFIRSGLLQAWRSSDVNFPALHTLERDASRNYFVEGADGERHVSMDGGETWQQLT